MYENLGYDYSLPTSSYTPTALWTASELAAAHYPGSSLDRGWLDGLVRDVKDGLRGGRRVRWDEAREMHRRVYFMGEREEGSRTLGGAAGFQAFL
jgi:hypothetical protein